MLKKLLQTTILAAVFSLPTAYSSNAADDDGVTIGFAVAFTGWEAAYDGEATKMAQLWIEQQNAKGGLLGKGRAIST